MEDAVKAEAIVEALRGFRYLYSNERELQLGVARALKAKGIPFVREKDLGRAGGTIDFMVGRVGIEVKIKGSPSAVARQLMRYCECDEVEEIILFTGAARLGALPTALRGKRLLVVTLWASMLSGGERPRKRRKS